MTDQDNDDEIRESIPCVTVAVIDEVCCLPVGYSIWGREVFFRGRSVDVGRPGDDVWEYERYEGEPGAWQHAIEREKARRAKVKEHKRIMHVERLREIAYMLEAFAELRDEGETCSALYKIADMIEAGELP
jgi:hypothetical protein